ncbi:MAG: hypothetical protein ISN64_02215 [Rickettsia sp.]|nr:hypothetical protein [Rickettsia sp.]
MFFSKILINFFCTKVFEDSFGNEYFISQQVNHLGRNRRYVIFNANNKTQDTSILSSRAFMWLHYSIDHFQDEVFQDRKFWYKENLGNLTGTAKAHSPYQNN